MATGSVTWLRRTGSRASRSDRNFDSQPLSVQIRPVLNGFDLTHRGSDIRAYVFTSREAEVARLVPPRQWPMAAGCALSDAGQVVSLAVTEGQEVRPARRWRWWRP